MLYVLIMFLLFFPACSAVPQKGMNLTSDIAERSGGALGPEIYRIGELEVRVYKDRETMVPDLPDLPKLIDGLRVGSKQVKIYGYYDKVTRRIYTVNDIGTLIHELKHYLEPDWEHPPPLIGDVNAGELRNAESAVKNTEESSPRDQKPLPKLSCLPACLR